MTRYKIALVCDWYLPRIGGLEYHMHDLAHRLVKAGHEVHIICAIPGPAEDGPIKIHRLAVPLMPILETIWNRRAYQEFEGILRAERFDVVHAHTAFSPLSHVAAHVCHRLGIPSVFTEHSVLRGLRSGAFFRSLDKALSWTRWPTVFTTVSGFVAADVRALTRRDDVYVVHNAVDIADWRVEGRVESPELRVTGVMRLMPRKRPLDFIRLIPRVLGLLPPGVRPRFTLIGDGIERPKVEREIRRLGVGEYVELLGFLPRAEVRDILASSAMFILPTLKEALSIASIEARCVGVPVVAMNQGGVGEVIEHGRQGFLASTFDEFVGYVAQLLREPELRRQFSEETQRGLERFSWEHAVSKYTDIYRIAIERVRSPSEAAQRAAAASAGLS